MVNDYSSFDKSDSFEKRGYSRFEQKVPLLPPGINHF